MSHQLPHWQGFGKHLERSHHKQGMRLHVNCACAIGIPTVFSDMDVMSWKAHWSSEYQIIAHDSCWERCFLAPGSSFCCTFYNRSQAPVVWKPSSRGLALALSSDGLNTQLQSLQKRICYYFGNRICNENWNCWNGFMGWYIIVPCESQAMGNTVHME